MSITQLTSSDAVRQAIAECDSLGRDVFLDRYGFRYSRLYLLYFDGKTYDSKAIAGVAFGYQYGTPLRASQFSGGDGHAVAVLRKLGFDVRETANPLAYLHQGQVYFRKDLVTRFGGQLQAGIWTPKEFPFVFIFSGESGAAYGRRDGWSDGDAVFKYTGEGQAGDMSFTGGNKAIRDHRANHRDLLLFSDLGKGKGVRFEGAFEVASWESVQGPDRDGQSRKMIVFDLVPVSTPEMQDSEPIALSTRAESIENLRKAAYEAAGPTGRANNSGTSARRVWYERSERVRSYVLARAAGICELCGCPAFFTRRDGSPYLEPHHTTRLADQGPDHPAWVGAICPTCHRRIHSGSDGRTLNRQLQERLRELEERLNNEA